MKYYKLSKIYRAGADRPFKKVVIESTDEHNYERLVKELMDVGIDKKDILKHKAYRAEEVPAVVAIVNAIYKNEKKYYEGVYVPSNNANGNGQEYIEYLDNPAHRFNNYEIAEYYNMMNILNRTKDAILYIKDTCVVLPHFTENFDKLQAKVQSKYDILILGMHYNKDKFDNVDEDKYLCQPNKSFVEEGQKYFANNVTSAVFSKSAVKEIREKMKTMQGQFWFEIAKMFLNRDLIAYYSCVNLIGELRVSDKPATPVVKEVNAIGKEKELLPSIPSSVQEKTSDIESSISSGIKKGLSDLSDKIASGIVDGFSKVGKKLV